MISKNRLWTITSPHAQLHRNNKYFRVDLSFKTDLTTVRSCQTSAAECWALTLLSPHPPFTASPFSLLVSGGGSNESASWARQNCAQPLTLPKSVCACVRVKDRESVCVAASFPASQNTKLSFVASDNYKIPTGHQSWKWMCAAFIFLPYMCCVCL